MFKKEKHVLKKEFELLTKNKKQIATVSKAIREYALFYCEDESQKSKYYHPIFHNCNYGYEHDTLEFKYFSKIV